MSQLPGRAPERGLEPQALTGGVFWLWVEQFACRRIGGSQMSRTAGSSRSLSGLSALAPIGSAPSKNILKGTLNRLQISLDKHT